MTCRIIKIDPSDRWPEIFNEPPAFAFICGDFEDMPPCRICGCWADKLCDYPIGNDKTCDSRMCTDCAIHVKGDLDYCPEHGTEYGKILYITRLENNGSGI